MFAELMLADTTDEVLAIERYNMSDDEVLVYIPAPTPDELSTQLDVMGRERSHQHVTADYLYQEVITPTLQNDVPADAVQTAPYQFGKEVCTQIAKGYAFADALLPALDVYGPETVPEMATSYRETDAPIARGIDIREVSRDELARFYLEAGPLWTTEVLDHLRGYRDDLDPGPDTLLSGEQWNTIVKFSFMETVREQEQTESHSY